VFVCKSDSEIDNNLGRECERECVFVYKSESDSVCE